LAGIRQRQPQPARWRSLSKLIIIVGMAKIHRGLYRIFGWAYVTDGHMTYDMREEDYRLKGCVPEYNKLPSKPDYDAAEAERETSGRRKGEHAQRP
jgi:hypothetical protein